MAPKRKKIDKDSHARAGRSSSESVGVAVTKPELSISTTEAAYTRTTRTSASVDTPPVPSSPSSPAAVPDWTEKEAAAKKHIEEIRRSKFSIGAAEPNPLMIDLHYAVKNLAAELYTKDVNFLMELIQNAEDNTYPAGVAPSLEMVITSNDITCTGASATLLVFNNEVGFSKANIDSICSVGRSTKKGRKNEGFVGEKGIGFKSVFLASKQPYILSNGYKIRFNEEPSTNCPIGYIAPEWVDEKPTLHDIQKEYGFSRTIPITTIILPLRLDKISVVREQLAYAHSELLLFLSKIRTLSVRENGPSIQGHPVSKIVVIGDTVRIKEEAENADSCKVRLSFQTGEGHVRKECQYYIWRQAFPVKPDNKVEARKDIDETIISLAFPLGERLNYGGNPVGVYAFLPTSMITNFPFIIQADFLLASSRECILLDNIWNLGILDILPIVFVNAFIALLGTVKRDSLSSVCNLLCLLPAMASSVPELEKVRCSIKTILAQKYILPCGLFSSDQVAYREPTAVARSLPGMWKLLDQAKDEGLSICKMPLSGKYLLHPSVDTDKLHSVLCFLGVSDANLDWNFNFLVESKLFQLSSAHLYVNLLLFLDSYQVNSVKSSKFPILRYVDYDGRIRLCSGIQAQSTYQINCALNTKHSAWLDKWNIELKCPGNCFFVPPEVHNAFAKRGERLAYEKLGVRGSSVSTYIDYILKFMSTTMDCKLIIKTCHFLYHSLSKYLITEYDVYNSLRRTPVIDNKGNVITAWSAALVPASGSKWVKLFGINPFCQQKYVELGIEYAKAGKYAGESTCYMELMNFVMKYIKAKDLPKLQPPDTELQAASTCLSKKQAFLLLDWLKHLRTYGHKLPVKFKQSIEHGKWLKSCNGFSSPDRCFLLKREISVLSEMGTFLACSVIDTHYYDNEISTHKDELMELGVKFGSKQALKVIIKKLALASAERVPDVILFLKFVRCAKKSDMLDDETLGILKQKKFLKTSGGLACFEGAVLLTDDREAVSQITDLLVIDELSHGGEINMFVPELSLLGVIVQTDQLYNHIVVDRFKFPEPTSNLTKNSSIFIFRCIKNMESCAIRLIEKVRDRAWIKTSIGFKCPSQCLLFNEDWAQLLTVVDVPLVDEKFYGSELRLFISELKTLGVGVSFDDALKIVVDSFKKLASSESLTSHNVLSLFRCIRNMHAEASLLLSVFNERMSVQNWLKTRLGYKPAPDTILFDARWGTISQFVDLPLIDDSFYGIGIYAFKPELKLIGTILEFAEGSHLVAMGLNIPEDPGILSAAFMCSLLECIGYMTDKVSERPLSLDFLSIVKGKKWLKTLMGYKSPEDCLLYNHSWTHLLEPEDGPFLDEIFYGASFLLYTDQLKAIGVKEDAQEVCSKIVNSLFSYTDTSKITRIYGFLSKCQWKPEKLEACCGQVWIPDSRGNSGKWVSSLECVVRDSTSLFSSKIFVLEKYYQDEALSALSTAFGVRQFPSLHDYVKLWNEWELDAEVMLEECMAFWSYVLEHWNSDTESILKQNVTKLPSCSISENHILLLDKSRLLIPDDIDLEKMFLESTELSNDPLFLWLPNASTISLTKLFEVYNCLEVDKLSESVHLSPFSFPAHHVERDDLKKWLLGSGLIKIVTAYLASRIGICINRRHEIAKKLLDLSIYEIDKHVTLQYQLKTRFAQNRGVKRETPVYWESDSSTLLVRLPDWNDQKATLEFAVHFAQTLSNGMLNLNANQFSEFNKIIQIGFLVNFEEQATELILLTENLRLLREDRDFLSRFVQNECPDLISYRRSSVRELLFGSSPLKKARLE